MIIGLFGLVVLLALGALGVWVYQLIQQHRRGRVMVLTTDPNAKPARVKEPEIASPDMAPELDPEQLRKAMDRIPTPPPPPDPIIPPKKPMTTEEAAIAADNTKPADTPDIDSDAEPDPEPVPFGKKEAPSESSPMVIPDAFNPEHASEYPRAAAEDPLPPKPAQIAPPQEKPGDPSVYIMSRQSPVDDALMVQPNVCNKDVNGAQALPDMIPVAVPIVTVDQTRPEPAIKGNGLANQNGHDGHTEQTETPPGPLPEIHATEPQWPMKPAELRSVIHPGSSGQAPRRSKPVTPQPDIKPAEVRNLIRSYLDTIRQDSNLTSSNAEGRLTVEAVIDELHKNGFDIAADQLDDGEPGPAISALEELTQEAEKVRQEAAQNSVKALHHLGLMKSVDQPQMALDYFRHAVDLDPKNLESWVQLGNILSQLGISDIADDAYGYALKLTGPDTDPNFKINLLNNLSLLACKLGDRDRSVDYLGLAIETSEDAAPDAITAKTWANLGKTCLLMGELEGAEQAYAFALADYERDGPRQDLAKIHAQLGLIRMSSGALTEAKAHFKQATKMTRQLNLKEDMGDILCGLGLAELMLHHPENASKHWRRSRAVYQEVGALREANLVDQLLQRTG